MDQCIAAARWFPAMVGNHVADIVEKYGADTDNAPRSLTACLAKRRGCDYKKHGAGNNPFPDFITDDIAQGFCVLGNPADHIARLRRLRDAGVTQFNIYLDNGNEEEIIAGYAERIIPECAEQRRLLRARRAVYSSAAAACDPAPRSAPRTPPAASPRFLAPLASPAHRVRRVFTVRPASPRCAFASPSPMPPGVFSVRPRLAPLASRPPRRVLRRRGLRPCAALRASHPARRVASFPRAACFAPAAPCTPPPPRLATLRRAPRLAPRPPRRLVPSHRLLRARRGLRPCAALRASRGGRRIPTPRRVFSTPPAAPGRFPAVVRQFAYAPQKKLLLRRIKSVMMAFLPVAGLSYAGKINVHAHTK